MIEFKNTPKEFHKITSLYNPEYIDFSKEKLFFGKGKNTQRYDVVKYPFIDKWTDNQMGQEWTHNEIKLTPDKIDFNTIQKAEKHIVTKVLQKLIFLDSLTGRGILSTLGSICTLPELEACLTEWQRFEINKHSRSYTEILRGIYDSPSEIFDESFKIPELMYIAKSISEPYNELFELVTEYNYNIIKNIPNSKEFMKTLKKSILKFIVTVNILEGVRFYSGFASIWAINYGQGTMERTSRILKLICRDENLHLQVSQYLLRILRENKDEDFTEVYEEFRPEILKMYEDAYLEEEVWIDVLFREGNILGLNASIAKEYMKYLINKRLKTLREPELFKGFNTNPIPWVENYINYDVTESRPQEMEIINYANNIIDYEISDENLNKIKRLSEIFKE